VPERREERTTEGGIDAAGHHNRLAPHIRALTDVGIRVSLFIEADPRQFEASKSLGAPVVELHTGAYAEAWRDGNEANRDAILNRLRLGARAAHALGLEVHAGHGLTYDNVKPVAAIPELVELNIGHFLIGEAIFIGLDPSIRRMRALMDEARK
jgi:pyridoxine 5-phosphate synthase